MAAYLDVLEEEELLDYDETGLEEVEPGPRESKKRGEDSPMPNLRESRT